LNDLTETIAIKAVFGDYAKKSACQCDQVDDRHLLGAAGSTEAIFTLLSIRDGIMPPTINYEEADPQCDLDYVPNVARRKLFKIGMSNSFGLAGPMPRSSLKDLKDKRHADWSACDHGGSSSRGTEAFLKSLGAEPMDMGTFSEESVDYPDFGCWWQKKSPEEIGKRDPHLWHRHWMSMVANKFPRVRAALANDLYSSVAVESIMMQ